MFSRHHHHYPHPHHYPHDQQQQQCGQKSGPDCPLFIMLEVKRGEAEMSSTTAQLWQWLLYAVVVGTSQHCRCAATILVAVESLPAAVAHVVVPVAAAVAVFAVGETILDFFVGHPRKLSEGVQFRA